MINIYFRHSRRYCNAPKPSKDPAGDECEIKLSYRSMPDILNDEMVGIFDNNPNVSNIWDKWEYERKRECLNILPLDFLITILCNQENESELFWL